MSVNPHHLKNSYAYDVEETDRPSFPTMLKHAAYPTIVLLVLLTNLFNFLYLLRKQQNYVISIKNAFFKFTFDRCWLAWLQTWQSKRRSLQRSKMHIQERYGMQFKHDDKLLIFNDLYIPGIVKIMMTMMLIIVVIVIKMKDIYIIWALLVSLISKSDAINHQLNHHPIFITSCLELLLLFLQSKCIHGSDDKK